VPGGCLWARAVDAGRRQETPTRGKVSPWRHGWGGRCRRGIARERTRTCVRVQECPGTRTTGRKDTTKGGVSARRGGTPASLARPKQPKGERGCFHSRVHTCVSSRGRRVCEHTGAEAMAAGQDGGGATVSGKRRLRKGSARGVEGSGTCKRFPSMTRRPASHGGKRSSAKVFGSITAHKAASRPWLEGQVPQREVERGAHHWSKGTRR
jgi:hypothetical protein